jgi:putative transposase
MKKNVELLEPDHIYHIYNRGINGENIFKEERNYAYFLTKYAQYIEPVAETFAYCLLKNHFHIAIRTRSEAEIVDFYLKKKTKILQNTTNSIGKVLNPNIDQINAGRVQNPTSVEPYSIKNTTSSHIIGKQFADFFNSYAQSINKANFRTGGLFEEPFRRILVDSDAYFTELIYYTHHNPQKHGFVKDFRAYPHSSYHSHLSMAMTRLRRQEVWDWFGNINEFEKFHIGNPSLENLDKFIIEFD